MAPRRPNARGHSGTPSGVELPHWFHAVFVGAVEHALAEADWQEHGAPKLAAWIRSEIERVAENVHGVDGEITKALRLSGDGLDALSDRLRPVFRDTHGIHERNPGYTSAWMVEQVAEGLGARFAVLAPIGVPRFLLETIRAGLDLARRPSKAELTRVVEDLASSAPHPALRDRLRELLRSQQLVEILYEELPLEAVLAVRAVDDVDADEAALHGALSAEARRYRPTERFAVGEVLDHPKLGRGLVLGLGEGKITVRFDGGERVLVHAVS